MGMGAVHLETVSVLCYPMVEYWREVSWEAEGENGEGAKVLLSVSRNS